MKPKLSMAWSGGKDCSLALWKLQNQSDFDIVELHTTVNGDTRRVGMHGVALDLIQAQGDRLNIPIHFIEIPSDSTNDSYEKAMDAYYNSVLDRGIGHIGFGDIFLEDLKAYRDQMLEGKKLEGVYPLWMGNSQALAEEFIVSGFKAIICAGKQYPHRSSLAGLNFNHDFLREIPEEVDPCGENGEFHSFVINGPNYTSPISIDVGEIQTHHYHFKDKNGIESKTSFDFADLRLS